MIDMSTSLKQYDSNFEEYRSYKKSKKSLKQSNKDPLICNYCSRLSANEIRCLGKYLADNDC